MTFKSYDQLKNKTLHKGDTLIFTVNENILTYQVKDCLLMGLGCWNDEIFDALNIEAKSFCDQAYGYSATNGLCPMCYHDDYAALKRLALALFKKCETFNNPLFDLFIVD